MLHLFSVLGTSLYEPIHYENAEKLDMYVQSSMVRKFKDELKNDGKVTILVTKLSRKMNWEDRAYTERDQDNSERWIENSASVKAGDTNRGLFRTLTEEFGETLGERIEAVSIPDGKNPEEIMQIFETIYEQIRDDDEIVFDITHSFRSIPMIIMSVLRYARTMKRCKLRGIYYGAYEARNENNVAPVIDLSMYNDIMEWSFAAEQFLKRGNAQSIKDAYDDTHMVEKNPTLDKAVEAMTDLSETIIYSRGSSDGNKGAKDKTRVKQSIKQAYNVLKQIDLSCIDRIELDPIKELISGIRDKYECLDETEDYKIGMAVVRLCIEYDMINQGYTALEETIKTYLCEVYGLDSQKREDREDKVALVIGTRNAYTRVTDSVDKWVFFTGINYKSKKKYEESSSDEQLLLKTMYEEIPDDFIKVSSEIGNLRNDINHFGIRKQPMEPAQLKRKLGELTAKAQKAMEEFDRIRGRN